MSLWAPSPTAASSRCPASPHRLNFLHVVPLAVSTSILTFLPLPSIASCSAVSALLFVLCQDDRVWRQLCAGRWRHFQHARSLLSKQEWTALYGDDEKESDGGKEPGGDEAGRSDSGRSGGGGTSGAGGADSSPDTAGSAAESSPQSWKERYIGCEVDVCRSYISMDEVTRARWAFRFLNVFFNNSQVARTRTALTHSLTLSLARSAPYNTAQLVGHALLCQRPCSLAHVLCVLAPLLCGAAPPLAHRRPTRASLPAD